MRRLLNVFYNYKNCFDLKNIEMFFEYNNTNYIINLLFEIKLLYNSLYALFEKKLYILQNYLLENLVSKYICKSINNTNISILFILKRDKSLCFYVNYWNLNTIIIKIRYLLFFIQKTLNCLISVVYFIKLDLKNVYYRICIYKSNK